ncbi:diguanylate cyclase (GGDEF)-like protein [Azospirillum agricola]|uniref:sensor domain-containing diguanylate cyclase n=1 Tax=Azospirillum agricola TaxID=1720247 RepID=UPI001AE53915|nr:sensor domain-containing diguanylate cyclase [Azospirillum agricola]MBP2229983.1 diguanylate cyclase (GGDEF)-like protein [Azospirillum agricola]
MIALGAVLFLQQRQDKLEDARREVLQLAQRGAQQQTDIVEQVRGTLRLLALVPEVRRADPVLCAPLLRQAAALYPWSVGFAVAAPDGNLRCSTHGDTPVARVAEQEYFRKALATRAFATSDFRIGLVSGRPVVTAALPLLDADGKVERLLLTGIDLNWLEGIAREAAHTSGGAVTLFDSRRTVLVRVPDTHALPPGRSMADHPLTLSMAGRSQGVIEAPGLDGVPRIIGFAALGETGGLIAVGVPRATILADLDRKLLWSAGVMAVVVLVIVVGVWFLLDILVLRGLRDLKRSAKRLSTMEFDARHPCAPAPIQTSEIGDAVRAVRSMGRTLHAIAFKDSLTGLANRRFLDAHMERLAEAPPGGGPAALAALCIDLDGFKPVNDQHGHHVGDAVLEQVAARLAQCVRDGDIAVRLGGDEFLVLLAMPDAGRTRLPLEVANRIIQTLSLPMTAEGLAVQVGCSVGIALWPTDDPDLGTVLRYADQALYAAKRGGRGQAMRYEAAALPPVQPVPG